MIHIKAPDPQPYNDQPLHRPFVFLAGAVLAGKDWRDELLEELNGFDVTVIDPRRDDWGTAFKEDEKDPKFAEQVSWEHKGIEIADIIPFYFAGACPITLLEFGYCIGGTAGVPIVSCADSFEKADYVHVVCDRHSVAVESNLQQLIYAVRHQVEVYQGEDFLRSRPDLLRET